MQGKVEEKKKKNVDKRKLREKKSIKQRKGMGQT